MKKLVGEYFLGFDSIQVFVDNKSNDCFAQVTGDWVRQGPVRKGFLTIGIDQSFPVAVGGLLHEAMEYVSVRQQLRFHGDLRAHEGPSVGIFLMTHDQFSEVTDTVGPFLADCLPAFNKAYCRYHRK